MVIKLLINETEYSVDVSPSERLAETLRNLGFLGVKSGGCSRGECGACTILLDGTPVNSCMYLSAQAEGHHLETVEKMGEHPDQGWKKPGALTNFKNRLSKSGPSSVVTARLRCYWQPNHY